jgi:electron transport complex protein RnfA
MILDILAIFLSVALVDNYVFSQTLGICPFLGVSSKPSTALGMGLAVTFVMTMSNAVTRLVFDLLLKGRFEYLQTVVFILIIASLVQLIEMMLKKLLPSLYGALGIYLPLITTNCAVLGAATNALGDQRASANILFSSFYGFSAAIGFTIAILIFAGVRARIDEESVPEPFRGTPITLIGAGITALVFNGLLSGIKF